LKDTKLIDLDLKAGYAGSKWRHKSLKKPVSFGFAAVIFSTLVLFMARSPEPSASMLSLDDIFPGDTPGETPYAGVNQGGKGIHEKQVTHGNAPNTHTEATNNAPSAGPGKAAAGDADFDTAEASPTRRWIPSFFLDPALPVPNHHDHTTGESLLMLELISLAPKPEPALQSVTVRSGDSLGSIFNRAGLSARDVHDVVNSDDRVKALQRIYPGDKLRFRIDDDGKLLALHYELDNVRTLQVQRNGDGFDVDIHEESLETRILHATGVIDRSFFLTGRRAGLSHGQLMEFMSIFEWQLDFNRDVRAGDAFSVVYEAEFLDDKQVGTGRILAAKLINRGRKYNALHYELDGESGYFDADGENMRKAFLRRPIQNARISSSFNRNRKHPVLGVRRPHLGTDFAAPTGTPIMASGSGRVIHRDRKGGYGHTVIIQHSNQYRTLYAHMSRYGEGISNGSRVEQGQIIGYVGRSGMATGPHLHYEFMVNGNHSNPMTVDLPNGDRIPDGQMSDFKSSTSAFLARIQTATQTQLASLEED